MKAKFLLHFIVGMILLLTIQPTVSFASFSDTNGHAHEEAIMTLAEKGIINGYADQTFKPDALLYRKNVVQLLGRWLLQNHFELPEDASTYSRFTDLPATQNELLALSSLVQEEGLFVGAQGYLQPNQTMTREQMAVVLVRAMKTVYAIDLVAAYQAANFSSNVADLQAAMDKEKRQAITALHFAQIISEAPFQPAAAITRGEFAALLAGAIRYFEQTGAVVEQTDAAVKDVAGAASLQIRPGAPLYASRNGKNRIATWGEQKLIFPIEPIDGGAYFAIHIASERYYVKAEDVWTTATPIQSIQHAPIGTVRTAATYTIVDYNYEPIMTAHRDKTVDVLGVRGDYYIVQMPAGQALLAKSQANVDAKRPLVLVEDAKLTKKANGTTAIVGWMKKGHVFTNFQPNGQRYVLQSGTTTYEMMPLVINTTNAAEHEPFVQGAYPTQLVAEMSANVYSRSGKLIGTLDRGQKVTLLNKTASRGQIEFAGSLGYIDLSQWLHVDAITPTRNISYTEMTYRLQLFHLLYPEFTELVSIGKSVEGRELYALRVGNGKHELLMDGALHAREHMTTNVLLEMIDEYTIAYARGTKFSGIDVRQTLDTTRIWFIPMMNPDGVTLVQGGVRAVASQSSVLKISGSSKVTHWKANIRGVDLNRNFEGGWLQKSSTKAPAAKNFKGYSVFSEPESRALRDFVAKRAFKAYISYHSSGQVIYWFHFQQGANLTRDKAFAQRLGNITGYSLMAPIYVPGSGASTDWFMQTYKKPAVTMEIAPYAGEGPVPHSQWKNVWNKNKTIGLVGAQAAANF